MFIKFKYDTKEYNINLNSVVGIDCEYIDKWNAIKIKYSSQEGYLLRFETKEQVEKIMSIIFDKNYQNNTLLIFDKNSGLIE